MSQVSLSFFHSNECPVCHEKAPVAAQVARDAGLPLEQWNIDEPSGSQEAERRRIRIVPTLALVDGEHVRLRLVGRMITPENVSYHLARFGR